MSELESQIQQWVALDNQLKQYTDKAREIRNTRNSVSDHITSYIETQQLTNATVEITDGRLRFQNTKSTAPLTFKFIEQCLNEVIGDEWAGGNLTYHLKSRPEWNGFVTQEKISRYKDYMCIDDNLCVGSK